MSSRALIINNTTGVIARRITAPPSLQVLQPRSVDESLFVVVDDDGGVIDDSLVILSETGEWAWRDAPPEDLSLPTAQIEYVAL